MNSVCDVVEAQVPADLLLDGPWRKRFHAWKAATVVKSCVPIRRMLRAPYTEKPGILMYHRVVPLPAAGPPPTWNVTPDRFRAQLSGLLDSGYVAWPLSRLIWSTQQGAAIPDNVFVVTFDDGYANNFLYAFPILQELRIPATIFLATAFLNSTQPFPFDDWSMKGHSAVDPETWRALTVNECRQMMHSGLIELGTHTHTHEDFRDRSFDFRNNLCRSLQALHKHFGLQHPTASLPYGIVSKGFAGPEYYNAAAAAGATCCLTTEEELVNVAASPFGWGRFIAEQHDSAATLAVKLDGWRDAARDQWRQFRGKSENR